MSNKASVQGRLFEIKNTDAYYQGDKALREEYQKLRRELRNLELAEMSPMQRAMFLIDERSRPTAEELAGQPPLKK